MADYLNTPVKDLVIPPMYMNLSIERLKLKFHPALRRTVSSYDGTMRDGSFDLLHFSKPLKTQ